MVSKLLLACCCQPRRSVWLSGVLQYEGELFGWWSEPYLIVGTIAAPADAGDYSNFAFDFPTVTGSTLDSIAIPNGWHMEFWSNGNFQGTKLLDLTPSSADQQEGIIINNDRFIGDALLLGAQPVPGWTMTSSADYVAAGLEDMHNWGFGGSMRIS